MSPSLAALKAYSITNSLVQKLTVKCFPLLETFAFLYVCFVLRGKISNLVPPSPNYEDYNTLAQDNMITGDFALLV